MSYNGHVKGALKLKGGDASGPVVGKVKKKKKEKKRKAEDADLDDNNSPGHQEGAAGSNDPKDLAAFAEKRDDEYEAKPGLNPGTNVPKTASEKAFALARAKREGDRVKKQMKMTHRERMELFNHHLSSLGEHFDIPKVGPG